MTVYREDPAAGNLITFAQFAFIALEVLHAAIYQNVFVFICDQGLIGHLDGFGLKKRAIAIQYYLLQVKNALPLIDSAVFSSFIHSGGCIFHAFCD